MKCKKCESEKPMLFEGGLCSDCYKKPTDTTPRRYKKHATQMPPKHDRICPECGEEFKAHYGMKRYCSESCQKTACNRRFYRRTFYVIEKDGLFYRSSTAGGGEKWVKQSLAKVYQTKPRAQMALRNIGEGEIVTIKREQMR